MASHKFRVPLAVCLFAAAIGRDNGILGVAAAVERPAVCDLPYWGKIDIDEFRRKIDKSYSSFKSSHFTDFGLTEQEFSSALDESSENRGSATSVDVGVNAGLYGGTLGISHEKFEAAANRSLSYQSAGRKLTDKEMSTLDHLVSSFNEEVVSIRTSIDNAAVGGQLCTHVAICSDLADEAKVEMCRTIMNAPSGNGGADTPYNDTAIAIQGQGGLERAVIVQEGGETINVSINIAIQKEIAISVTNGYAGSQLYGINFDAAMDAWDGQTLAGSPYLRGLSIAVIPHGSETITLVPRRISPQSVVKSMASIITPNGVLSIQFELRNEPCAAKIFDPQFAYCVVDADGEAVVRCNADVAEGAQRGTRIVVQEDCRPVVLANPHQDVQLAAVSVATTLSSKTSYTPTDNLGLVGRNEVKPELRISADRLRLEARVALKRFLAPTADQVAQATRECSASYKVNSEEVYCRAPEGKDCSWVDSQWKNGREQRAFLIDSLDAMVDEGDNCVGDGDVTALTTLMNRMPVQAPDNSDSWRSIIGGHVRSVGLKLRGYWVFTEITAKIGRLSDSWIDDNCAEAAEAWIRGGELTYCTNLDYRECDARSYVLWGSGVEKLKGADYRGGTIPLRAFSSGEDFYAALEGRYGKLTTIYKKKAAPDCSSIPKTIGLGLAVPAGDKKYASELRAQALSGQSAWVTVAEAPPGFFIEAFVTRTGLTTLENRHTAEGPTTDFWRDTPAKSVTSSALTSLVQSANCDGATCNAVFAPITVRYRKETSP